MSAVSSPAGSSRARPSFAPPLEEPSTGTRSPSMRAAADAGPVRPRASTRDDLVPVLVRVVHQDVWVQTTLSRSWAPSAAKQHIFLSAGLLPLPSPSLDAVHEFAGRPRLADAAAGDSVYSHLSAHRLPRTPPSHQGASKSTPSTPAAEGVPSSPFASGDTMSLGGGAPLYSLKSATSQVDLRTTTLDAGSPTPPNQPDATSLRRVSHGSPLAMRRLPPGSRAPTLAGITLPSLKPLDSPSSPPPPHQTHLSSTPRLRTASSVDTADDRPFSVLTTSSYTDSLPDSTHSTSSTSERADELRPLPDTCSTATPHLASSGPSGLRRKKSASSLDNAVASVPVISFQGPDALGRSLTGNVGAAEVTTDAAQLDGFDLVDAATGALLLSLEHVWPLQLIEVHHASAHLPLTRSDPTAYCQPCFQSVIWASHIAPQPHKHSHDGGTERLGWAKEWIRIQHGDLFTWRSAEAFLAGASSRSRHSLRTLALVREWDAPNIKSVRSMPAKSIQLGFGVRSYDSGSKRKTAWIWLRAPTESLHLNLLRVLSAFAAPALARRVSYHPPSFDRLAAFHLVNIATSLPPWMLKADARFQHLLQARQAAPTIAEHAQWSFVPLDAEVSWVNLQEEASFRGVEPSAELLQKVILAGNTKHVHRGIHLPAFHGRPSTIKLHKEDPAAPPTPALSPPPRSPAQHAAPCASYVPHPDRAPAPERASANAPSWHGSKARQSTRSLVSGERVNVPPSAALAARSAAESARLPLSPPRTPALAASVRHSLPASPRSARSAVSPTSVASSSSSSRGEEVESFEWVNPFGPLSDHGAHSDGRHAGGRSPAPSFHCRLTDVSAPSEHPQSPTSIRFPSRRSSLNSSGASYHGPAATGGSTYTPSASDHSIG